MLISFPYPHLNNMPIDNHVLEETTQKHFPSWKTSQLSKSQLQAMLYDNGNIFYVMSW